MTTFRINFLSTVVVVELVLELSTNGLLPVHYLYTKFQKNISGFTLVKMMSQVRYYSKITFISSCYCDEFSE